MALTEKQKQQIREEEAIRLEVRHERCGGRGHGFWRSRRFWTGFLLGLLVAWAGNKAMCRHHGWGGGYGKWGSCKHHSMDKGAMMHHPPIEEKK